MKIAVLGAGAFGASLGGILEEKGVEVAFYDPFKFPENELKEVLRAARAIVLATPSSVIPDLFAELPEFAFLKPLIVASKGMLSLRIFNKFERVEFVSGPAFARDVREKKSIKLTTTGEIAENLLKTRSVSFDKTNDSLGVVFCGSLKNIYAVEAGFRKLEPETIEFEQFIFKALEEIEGFLEENGARRETARLACGEGDLRLTCGSEESRNYRFGAQLRARYLGRPAETTEAIATVEELEREGLIIPKRAAILKGAVRRIKNAT